MGSACLVVVEPNRGYRAALNAAEAELRRIESVLTRFAPESELSVLNASGGGEMSSLMASAVDAALAMACETGGRYDPTVLGALELAGYDRSFDDLDGTAGGDVIHGAVGATSAGEKTGAPVRGRWRGVAVSGSRLDLPDGVRLDLGGIGKGWAADRLACSLSLFGGALVDLGGDCAAVAPGPCDGAWPVGVDHSAPGRRGAGDRRSAGPVPGGSRPGGDLSPVMFIEDGAVATSSTLWHRWRRGRGTAHHVIDPATGIPSGSDLVAVTVAGTSAAWCEARAKALLISGSGPALAEAGELGIDVLATRENGDVVWSGALRP